MFSAPSFWGPKMCFGDGQPAKVAALGGFRMDFVALIKPTKKQRKQQIQKQNRYEGTQNIDTQKEILFHKSWDSSGLRPTNNKMKRNNNNNNNNNKKNKVLQLAI